MTFRFVAGLEQEVHVVMLCNHKTVRGLLDALHLRLRTISQELSIRGARLEATCIPYS